MDELIEILGGITLGIVVIVFAAVIGGTIVYFVWPVAIPAAFPGLTSKGILATKLTWWQSVCLTWLFGCLFKSSIRKEKN